MFYKYKKGHLYIFAFIFNLLLVSQNYATVNNVKFQNSSAELNKLSEFNYFDVRAYDQSSGHNHLDDSEFTFNNRKHLTVSKFDAATKNLELSTKIFKEDFSDFEVVESKLNLPLSEGDELSYTDIYSNGSVAFLSVNTNAKDDTFKIDYYKSLDGVTWQPYSINDTLHLKYITHMNSNVIVVWAHDSTNNRYKELYSLDNGLSWQDMKVSYNNSFIGGFDSKVIFSKTDYETDTTTFYMEDLLDEQHKTVDVSLPKSLEIEEDGVKYSLELSRLHPVRVGNLLLAEANYYTFADEYISQDINLVSEDNGLHWTLVDLDFNNQSVAFISSKDDVFHVVTSTDLEESDDASDSQEPNRTQDEMEAYIKAELNKSKVYLYTLTKEQLLGDKSSLKADKVLDNTTANDVDFYQPFANAFELYYVNDDKVKLGYYSLG